MYFVMTLIQVTENMRRNYNSYSEVLIVNFQSFLLIYQNHIKYKLNKVKSADLDK